MNKITSNKDRRQRSELVKLLNDWHSQSGSRTSVSNELYRSAIGKKGISSQCYYSHRDQLEYLIQQALNMKRSFMAIEKKLLLESIITRNKVKLNFLETGHKVYMPNYYHATNIESAVKILESGEIQVRHEKAYRGAFVSTQPEIAFGDVIFVFSGIEIERKVELLHGFIHSDAFWAGFSQSISLGLRVASMQYIQSNLAYIITRLNRKDMISALKSKLNQLGLNKIEVISLEEAEIERQCLARYRGEAVTPTEWLDKADQDRLLLASNPLAAIAKEHISLPPVLNNNGTLNPNVQYSKLSYKSQVIAAKLNQLFAQRTAATYSARVTTPATQHLKILSPS